MEDYELLFPRDPKDQNSLATCKERYAVSCQPVPMLQLDRIMLRARPMPASLTQDKPAAGASPLPLVVEQSDVRSLCTSGYSVTGSASVD